MGSYLSKTLRGVLVASLALTLLAGETQAQELSAPQKGAPAPVQILDGTFIASQLDGATLTGLAQANRPRITFLDDNRIGGFSGCRAFEGQLVRNTSDMARVKVTKVTGAGCKGPLAQNESKLFASLKASRRLEILGGEVRVMGGQDQILVRLNAISPRVDQGPSLYGRTWVLTQINGTSPPKNDPKPTLVFTGTSIHGSTGCNQFSGTHARQAGKSAFVITTQTQRACLAPEGDPMTLETDYLSALASVDRISLTPSTLTLSASKGGANLVFSIAR
jgi:heat shock protein HslJ